jgi:lysophospholipid acyltransferase (LPLAT)-like uncharacterized protein
MPKLSSRTRSKLRKLTVPHAAWRLLGLVTTKSIVGLMSTLNHRIVRYDRTADPALEQFAGPVIFIFWHEYILFPFFLRPHSRLAILVSQHQDAEVLAHLADFGGLGLIRGSTHRGGSQVLKTILSEGQGRGMSVAISPDGPRGPRRQLAQGCVYLSSRLQIPIVPIGFGLDRPWRSKRSWDQFAIPRPGSRARTILGPRIQVPADLDREQIEGHRLWIEEQLNALTTAAEQWAEGKSTPAGAEPLCRAPGAGDGTGRPRSARLRY